MRYKIKKVVDKNNRSKDDINWAPRMNYLDGYIFDSEKSLDELQKTGTDIDIWTISKYWIFEFKLSNDDLISLKEYEI